MMILQKLVYYACNKINKLSFYLLLTVY